MYRYDLRALKGEDPVRARFRNTVKNTAILVLVIALIVGAVFAVPAFRYRSETADTYLQRVRSECSTAISLTNTLSRTAGSGTNSTLALVRSHIYAMEVISTLNNGMGGGYIIQPSVFSSLYSILDEYSSRMTTGTNTADQVTALQNSLQAVYDMLGAIE